MKHSTRTTIQSNAARALCALAVLAGASSCGPSSPPPPPTSQISAPPASQAQAPAQPQIQPQVAQSQTRIERSLSTSEAPAPAASGARDRADRRGRFKVVRRPARDPRYIKTRDSGFLEEIVADMNRTIEPKLPVDVPISFAELGQANAFYTPKERQILIGYELLDQITVLFLKSADRDDPKVVARVAQQVVDALSFVLYHEAAHAIIDLDDLPITGREEDAADQLATVMIVASAKSKSRPALKANGLTHAAQGGEAAINGAMFFLLSSGGEGKSVEDLPFWDEHSLSQQRFYNILTWVYGSDPDKYDYLVQRRILPESRAARARNEFTRMTRAWLKILEDARAA